MAYANLSKFYISGGWVAPLGGTRMGVEHRQDPLDPLRRAALFDRLRAGRAQIWLTGTELAPFEAIAAEASVWRVRDGSVERQG